MAGNGKRESGKKRKQAGGDEFSSNDSVSGEIPPAAARKKSPVKRRKKNADDQTDSVRERSTREKKAVQRGPGTESQRSYRSSSTRVSESIQTEQDFVASSLMSEESMRFLSGYYSGRDPFETNHGRPQGTPNAYGQLMKQVISLQRLRKSIV
uniref:Uncharacterized protein n=1 Tax=Palpitomonas bilix TaxID=652834 RepID=A0A7S3LVY0_9EUKA|mmetsp:Transcript_5300/g.11897  ORF Transcript_5300/g.11897 Transcript_5300/m.11897 type:complete len:153 (+) Transcript_5300:370-828(+)